LADRCNGLCCKAFVLGNYSHEELKFAFEHRRSAGESVQVPQGIRWIKPLEIETWWPWMIHLGKFEVHPTTGDSFGKEVDFYTCSQLQPNGDCAVYKNRPHFCQSYGTSQCACEHKDCAWDVSVKVGDPPSKSLLEEESPARRNLIALKELLK
jgi:Fe-S-cluster containining protein